jgi:hypothetical protein
MFSTNVTGLINMTQAILPIYKARPEGGRGDIINIGSIAGREPYQGGSIYCATKAAVRSFTESLRKELIATRIRVIEIDPGQVETEFSVVRFNGDKEKAKKVYEGVEPLTGDDIAEVVVFAAGRRENVVLADTLVYPNHQVSRAALCERTLLISTRRRRRSCTGRRRRLTASRQVREETTCIESPWGLVLHQSCRYRTNFCPLLLLESSPSFPALLSLHPHLPQKILQISQQHLPPLQTREMSPHLMPPIPHQPPTPLRPRPRTRHHFPREVTTPHRLVHEQGLLPMQVPLLGRPH